MGLSYYNYGLQVPKLIADTAQQQVARKLAFMQADSAFARLSENAEKIGTPYPLAYYYRAQSTYFANGRDASLASGAPVPLYEKFIEQAIAAQANPETGATTKEQNRKYLITSYKYLIQNSIAKKDDAKAKDYANKVLELDPNDQAAKDFLNPPAPAAKPAGKPAAKPAPKKGSAK